MCAMKIIVHTRALRTSDGLISGDATSYCRHFADQIPVTGWYFQGNRPAILAMKRD